MLGIAKHTYLPSPHEAFTIRNSPSAAHKRCAMTLPSNAIHSTNHVRIANTLCVFAMRT